MTKKTMLSGFLASMALLLNACKTSGDAKVDKNYVDPTQIKTVDEGTEAAAGPVAPEALQRELEVARGEVENLKAKNEADAKAAQEKAAKLEAEAKELRQELVKLKSEKDTAGGEVAKAPIKVDGDMPQKSGAPLLWDLAVKNLKTGHFQEAVAPLDELIKTYPKDNKALKATLALAMTQYHLKKYKDSAITFNQVIDRFPKRSETALAWFGQGAAFGKMGQNDDSQLFFSEVIKRYPDSTQAKQAKVILKHRNKVPEDLFVAFPQWLKIATKSAL